MLSRAIWALFWSILIQNGITKTWSMKMCVCVGGGGGGTCCTLPGSATVLDIEKWSKSAALCLPERHQAVPGFVWSVPAPSVWCFLPPVERVSVDHSSKMRCFFIRAVLIWKKAYRPIPIPGLKLIQGHLRPWPLMPSEMALMPFQIFVHLWPKISALFYCGLGALW